MNNLPCELVNKIIMLNRPTYSYMTELEEHISDFNECNDDDFYNNFCEYMNIINYVEKKDLIIKYFLFT